MNDETENHSAETVARLEARIEYLEACEQASHEWMNRTSEQLAQLVDLVRSKQ